MSEPAPFPRAITSKETRRLGAVAPGGPDDRSEDSTTLSVPELDAHDPEVTILVPALDESLTIGDFVEWCKEGLAGAGVVGEILIVDSSTDDTPAIALAHGARVLHTPRRGLGRAYSDAIPYVRGRYVIMGDADCTYDFRNLSPFVEALRAGNEFVMGSRWLGTIEPGAMPALHRYLGTPLTTWILNRIYRSSFTDIHCGMRALPRESLLAMGLSSGSWEYASEMVLKSVRMGLSTVEVPVTFHKDRQGRLSHHKRAGFLSPFQAAWINLRAMFIYKADFFALKPGLVLFVLGLLLTVPLALGPISIGSVTFDLYTMLLGLTLTLLGLNSFFFGCIAQMFCDYTGAARARWLSLFGYTRVTVLSVTAMLAGVALSALLLADFISGHFTLPPPTATVDHLGVIGILLLTAGFSTFCFTLAIHATSVRYGPPPRPSARFGGPET